MNTRDEQAQPHPDDDALLDQDLEIREETAAVIRGGGTNIGDITVTKVVDKSS